VLDEDRASPIASVGRALGLLAGTAAGSTYTLSQLKDMYHAAGFNGVTSFAVPNSPDTIVLARVLGR
jgi:hypothetical protein